ncbi:von Hippel-Lindau-like protein isoform X2 [Stegostoma tigrinum]|uniref:von Hippel-Lindau-like protein isoform X2 n=1 Tax=Stegostoma tigrinum TaxID=3053191 RepID=UPI00202AC30D|nr:von Hippel-Lindau-like protein isoform X2 [Stegostoma tigrinum]
MAHTGEQPVSALRSLRSDEATFVKFVNRTLRNARPWWINFDGIPQSYADIPPGGVLHMRTYRNTGDKLLIKNDEIYFPTSKQYDEDGPTYIPVDVTIPVYSLKNCCLQRIRKHMKSDDYTKLELPKSLHTDLKNSPDLLRAIENLSKVYRNN